MDEEPSALREVRHQFAGHDMLALIDVDAGLQGERIVANGVGRGA